MAYLAGQKLRASDLNIPAVSNVDPTSRTTTSATYTTTLTAANICGVAFTAPPSGKVKIDWACDLANSAANFTGCSPGIRTGSTVGSGTVFLATSDDRSISTDAATFERQGASTLVTGLTAGSAYNVALSHRVGGGTGTFLRREVIVTPLLA